MPRPVQTLRSRRSTSSRSRRQRATVSWPGPGVRSYASAARRSSADGATFSFDGPAVRWTGSTNADHGLATVSVDGGPASTVDTYSAQWGTQAALAERTGLGDGPHTATIVATGQRSAASTGTCPDVDAFGD